MNIEPTGYYQLNGVATLDYYHEAIDYIRQYVDTPHFYVFLMIWIGARSNSE